MGDGRREDEEAEGEGGGAVREREERDLIKFKTFLKDPYLTKDRQLREVVPTHASKPAYPERSMEPCWESAGSALTYSRGRSPGCPGLCSAYADNAVLSPSPLIALQQCGFGPLAAYVSMIARSYKQYVDGSVQVVCIDRLLCKLCVVPNGAVLSILIASADIAIKAVFLTR